MSTGLSTAEQASVTAAESGVGIADKALDAAVVAKLGPAAPFITPIIDEGADALKAAIAVYLPRLEEHLVADIEGMLHTLGGKIASLFHHAPPIPVDPNSALAHLTNDEVAALYVALHTAEPIQPNTQVVLSANTWIGQSILDNRDGIEWLAKARGIVK